MEPLRVYGQATLSGVQERQYIGAVGRGPLVKLLYSVAFWGDGLPWTRIETKTVTRAAYEAGRRARL